MNALLIPVIPELPSLLGTDLASATWVITATLIASAVFTPIIGRMADLYGKRRIYLASLGVLATGALVAAIAPGIGMLLVGRVLQGAGVGIIPIGIAILRDVLPAAQLPGGIAVVSGSLGIGSAIGLPLASFVIALAGWKSVFGAAAAITVLLLIASTIALPSGGVTAVGRLDVLGAVLLAAWLLPLLLVLTKGAERGWTSVAVITMTAVVPVVRAVWTWQQLRWRSPLVDLRLAVRRPILLTNLASLALGFSMLAANIAFPQALRAPIETGSGLGRPLLAAGFALAPLGLVMLLFPPVGARVSLRHGPRMSLMAGGACVALAYLLATQVRAEVWQLMIPIILVGVGVGFGCAAMPALIMNATPYESTTSANALNALMRSTGTTVSSAAIGGVLAASTVSIGTGEWPTADALTMAFAIAAGTAILASVLAAFLPRKPVDADGQAYA